MKTKSLVTFGILSMVVFFIGLYTDNYMLRMIAKPFPVLAMLVLLKPVDYYSKFVFGGLIFSVTGDMLLEYEPSMFVYGLIAFLLAHVAYIAAFLKRSKKIVLIPLIFLMGYGMVVYWLLYPGLGNMAHPVLIYIIVILTMCWRAFAQTDFNKYAVYALAGALLFVVSDSLIAFNKFYVELEFARYLIMLTYWAAQSLIFYSAYATQKKLA